MVPALSSTTLQVKELELLELLNSRKQCLVAGQCGRVERPWTFETDTWILTLASQLGSYVIN